MKKTIISILIIIVVVLLIIWLVWSKTHQKSAGFQMPPTEVTVATAVHEAVPTIAASTGSLVANQHATLSPQSSGQIVAIPFKQGEFVKKGTLLIQINDAQQKADLHAAEAALVLAQATYKRQSALQEKGYQSTQTLETAQSNLASAKSNVAVDRVALQYKRITAPFDGYVGIRTKSVGDYVNPGDKVLEISERQNMKVQFSVSENYLSQLKLGQAVTLTSSSYPDETFSGKVIFISPTVNETTRSIDMQAIVPNKNGKLRAGAYMNTALHLGTNDNAVIVPIDAVAADIEGFYVYKVVKGKAYQQKVTTGTQLPTKIEILKGLKAGDVVVTQGIQKLRDGSQVKILTANKAAPATKNKKS